MVDAPLIGPVPAPGLHVMSYNIRRRMPHVDPRDPDRWSRRAPVLGQRLRQEAPALIGIQEALRDQAEFVQRALGPAYRRIGRGRDASGRGEGCPILWDSSRLRLERWEQRALSDTPHVSGSTGWGNEVPRMFLTAVFLDLVTGARFTAINTHFDHRSTDARLRSAEAILAAVVPEERVDSGSVGPTVVTGDFNTDVDSNPHRTLLDGGLLRDSWAAAAERLTPAWGTFLDYRAPRLDRKRIDWVLVSPTIEVVAVGIDAARHHGVWPSDHAAMHAVLRLGSRDDGVTASNSTAR
jgi:endonuclease/exonuclease/phosphatase family metal-dependent hydrolase